MKRLVGAVLAFALSTQPVAAAQRAVSLPSIHTVGAPLVGLKLPEIPKSIGQAANQFDLPEIILPSVEQQPSHQPQQLHAQQLQPTLPSKAAVAVKITTLAETIRVDVANLPNLGSEGAHTAAENHAQILLGGELQQNIPTVYAAAPNAGGGDSKPSAFAGLSRFKPVVDKTPQSPKKPEAPGVKQMMLAVPIFKIGAEAVSLAIPIIALQTGGALGVAGLVVLYQISQAIGGWVAAGLTARWRASAVAAGGLAVQAALIAAVVGLTLAGGFSYWMLFPTYAVVGATLGLIDTSRKSIPALLVGQDQHALRDYNARLHRRYEFAGVLGAFGIAGLMALVGPLWALALQPVAFAYAAYLMRQVKHARGEQAPPSGGLWSAVKNWGVGMRDGARIIARDPRTRWVAAAMILPLVVHRVFEDLFMPVYAKGVLGAVALAGVLRAISNLGELGGATALLRWSRAKPGAASWVKWGGVGMLAAWALSLAAGMTLAWSLVLLVPAIFLFSATWAAAHLSLESDLQERLPLKDQPHVLAVLNGLIIAATAGATFGLGRLIDRAGPAGGFLVIEIGLTILGVALLYAAARLKKTDRK